MATKTLTHYTDLTPKSKRLYVRRNEWDDSWSDQSDAFTEDSEMKDDFKFRRIAKACPDGYYCKTAGACPFRHPRVIGQQCSGPIVQTAEQMKCALDSLPQVQAAKARKERIERFLGRFK